MYLQYFQMKQSLTIQKFLSQGSYGKVFSCRDNKNNLYALKKIQKSKYNQKQSSIMSILNSQYCVKFYQTYTEEDNVCILMELCKGGMLQEFMQKRGQYIDDKQRIQDENWKIILQLLGAIRDLCQHNIVHRDLKPSNIFLTDENVIKVGDFGIAEINKKKMKQNIGTKKYKAPEMLINKEQYDEKVDIWAFGCIAYELCSFHHPFTNITIGLMAKDIKNCKRNELHPSISPQMKKLVNNCLEPDPIKRPTIAQILNKPEILGKGRQYGVRLKFRSIDKVHQRIGFIMQYFSQQITRIELNSDVKFRKEMNLGENSSCLKIFGYSQEDLNNAEREYASLADSIIYQSISHPSSKILKYSQNFVERCKQHHIEVVETGRDIFLLGKKGIIQNRGSLLAIIFGQIYPVLIPLGRDLIQKKQSTDLVFMELQAKLYQMGVLKQLIGDDVQLSINRQFLILRAPKQKIARSKSFINIKFKQYNYCFLKYPQGQNMKQIEGFFEQLFFKNHQVIWAVKDSLICLGYKQPAKRISLKDYQRLHPLRAIADNMPMTYLNFFIGIIDFSESTTYSLYSYSKDQWEQKRDLFVIYPNRRHRSVYQCLIQTIIKKQYKPTYGKF